MHMAVPKETPESTRVCERIRQLCSNSVLFGGWTPRMMMSVIRDMFKECGEEWALENLLNPGADKPMARQKHERDQDAWSYGYCYAIAQVAKLILRANPDDEYSTLRKEVQTKAARTGKSHWVLKSKRDGLIVDPEGEFSPSRYEGYKGKGIRWDPDARARLLFQRVIAACLTSGRFKSAEEIAAAENIRLELPRLERSLHKAIGRQIKAGKARSKAKRD